MLRGPDLSHMSAIKRTMVRAWLHYHANPVIDHLDYKADIAGLEGPLLATLRILDLPKETQRKNDRQVHSDQASDDE